MDRSVPLVIAFKQIHSWRHMKQATHINKSWLKKKNHNSLSDVNYGPCQTRLVKAIYSVHG